MEVVVVVGAGLDVHKKKIVACCLDGRSTPPTVTTCTFSTFKDDLERMRDWLRIRGVTHVAMESTGVYWIPVYQVLEGSVEIVLGNPRHMANVPGRKTDVSDAHWIAKLLRHGLIQPNFVPPRAIRDLRQATRYRRKLVQTRTSCMLRVEKLLQCSNIKLSSVASNIFGVSGRLMLEQLSQGHADPATLAELSKGTLRGKRGMLMRALRGSFSKEDSKLLQLELKVIADLEAQIERVNALIEEKVGPFEHVVQRFDTIPGVNRILAIDLLAEIGPDVSAWPTCRHFAAWTGTCPGNKESAGTRKSAKTREGNPYVKIVLIQAAVCARQTIGSHLAARFNRLAARRGPRRAVVAVAREIAVAIYYMVSRGTDYTPPEPIKHSTDRSKQLVRQLEKLGYEVKLELATT